MTDDFILHVVPFGGHLTRQANPLAHTNGGPGITYEVRYQQHTSEETQVSKMYTTSPRPVDFAASTRHQLVGIQGKNHYCNLK